MFEIKEDNFRNFSEDNLTLSSIEIKTMELELEMRKREKKDLQETLKRREKEIESMLMEIITVQNQNKIIGEQLFKTILENREEISTSSSEGRMTLKSIEMKTFKLYQTLMDLNAAFQITFSQRNKTKSNDEKCHSFGKFNCRIFLLQLLLFHRYIRGAGSARGSGFILQMDHDIILLFSKCVENM